VSRIIARLSFHTLDKGVKNLDDFRVKEISQVVEKKAVGETGFEPVSSTVCKRHTKRKKQRK